MPAGQGATSGPQHQRPHQQCLPPRSPVKTAKVCVPTLEDALDDVQVRGVLPTTLCSVTCKRDRPSQLPLFHFSLHNNPPVRV